MSQQDSRISQLPFIGSGSPNSIMVIVDYTNEVTGVTSAIYFSSVTASISGGTGTNGSSGTSGISGSSGTSGTRGSSGSSGSSGVTGASGSSGTSGTSGTRGSSGSSGTSGTSGANGTSGSSGTSGTSGANGTSGSSGTSGTSGTSGSSGTSGTSGSAGTSGISPSNDLGILRTTVINETGVTLLKGSAVKLVSSSNITPSVQLAIASKSGNNQVIGLIENDILNGQTGYTINNGVLSGVTVSNTPGGIIYLSDTIPGGYVTTTSSLAFSARTNEIGYTLKSGTTIGAIYVNINNEDINLSLTDIERNILEGNVISTGTYEFTGLTYTSGTTISISPMRGWIVSNTYEFATLPSVRNIIYTGNTAYSITGISLSDSTYILVNSGGTVFQQGTFPTSQQRRENIYLGKVVHPNRTTIQNVNNTVDYDVSPMSALRDLWDPINLINDGVIVSANGVNLNIDKSAGTLWGNGINWSTNQLSPNNVNLSGTSPTTFQYRTQTGGTFTNTTTIDTTNYDVGGVVTAVPGTGNYTTQRIYQFPTGLVRIQYGQSYYPTLAKAIAAIQSEIFVVYPNNLANGILIGLLTVKDGATDLTDVDDAVFTQVSKFGELLGGSGGLSTTTLQQAYDNSADPEIITTSGIGAFSIKNGTGNPDISTNLFEGINAIGGITSFITAKGEIVGSQITTNGAITGSTIIGNDISATTFNGNSNKITGTKGTITTSGNSTTALLTFSGSGTIGGTGYTDFIRVTNTAAGATTPSKTFRTDIFGSFEIINNAYNSTLLSLTDAGNLTVTGRVKSSINYSQVGGGASVTLSASGGPQTILSTTITTYGNPVRISAYGDAENTGAGYWCKLQFWRDSTQLGAIVHTEGSAASENTPFGMSYIDAPAAGTYTYYLKANEISGGSIKFGESTAPTLNVQEL